MLRQIAIINRSTVVRDADVELAVASLQTQVTRDFAPVWGIDAVVRTPVNSVADAERIYILDDSDQAGALGYHRRDNFGVPVGFVFAKTAQQAGDNWEPCLSHELLEQLADPWASWTVMSFLNGYGPVILPVEVCDAVEASEYEIDGIAVSNFVIPVWYQPNITDRPTDLLCKLKSSLTNLAGGYFMFCDMLGQWHTETGSLVMSHQIGEPILSRREHRIKKHKSLGQSNTLKKET